MDRMCGYSWSSRRSLSQHEDRQQEQLQLVASDACIVSRSSDASARRAVLGLCSAAMRRGDYESAAAHM